MSWLLPPSVWTLRGRTTPWSDRPTWPGKWRRSRTSRTLYDRLKTNGVRIKGIGDHGISLGVYLLDPDDNEIAVYYELPRYQWEPHPEKGLFGCEFPRRLEEPVGVADD